MTAATEHQPFARPLHDIRHPGDRLVAAINAAGTPACVGIDPVLERLPEGLERTPEGLADFGRRVIDAIGDAVGVVKLQSACYERHGWQGVRALEQTVAHARQRGRLVILDAKRGDIGISAEHYAAAAASMGADAITINGYLARSGIHPFVDAGLGVFVLVRTSNPDAEELQDVELARGGTVSERVAELVDAVADACRSGSHISSVGAVVAPLPRGGRVQHANTESPGRGSDPIRGVLEDSIFLVPGLGAQGGTAAQLVPMFREHATSMGTLGVLATASRSVTFPADAGTTAESWSNAVAAAAQHFASEVREVCQAALS